MGSRGPRHRNRLIIVFIKQLLQFLQNLLFGKRRQHTVELTEQETVDLDEVPEIEVRKPDEQKPVAAEEPKRGITEDAYRESANIIGCEVARIKAVSDVESRGAGFLEDGRPKILFEAHHFSRLTGGNYNESHPNISSPSWDRSLYKGGAAEHDRIQKAMELDREAALKSSSWGKFQIMGWHWDTCEYDNLQAFINGMWRSEGEHLRAFTHFIQSEGLDKPLRQGDWHAFARGYNGPQYQKNNYAERMKQAYENHKS